MAVRLQATSELLIIDTIDSDTAIALCRRFGSAGPEGCAEPFSLDSLRENVIRAPRQAVPPEPSMLRRMICRLGSHRWQSRIFRDRPQLGDVHATVCRDCGEIRVQD